ncbi:MAG TPA: DNA methyltransferase [Haliangiales bacterium]|nr:DNA methyltransferase [Haliangiales bacterium]
MKRFRDVMTQIAGLANAPRRDSGATRGVYSYPAKFQAHLPAELIRLFTRAGDLVVDPWAGGGTTALEAMLLGRRCFSADLSPFACLVARVKTTRVARARAEPTLAAMLASRAERPILDDEDARCLGARIAGEIARLAAATDALPPAIRDLFRVVLIHTVKIAGRRDFDDASILPTFARRARRTIAAVAALPDGPPPVVACRSNHDLGHVGDAALVVTSPPYKDLDVEYGLVQIQRPALARSKRSRLIWRLLGGEEIPRKVLCGGTGDTYWKGLAPALAEVRRVLRRGAPAFFWTGFKTPGDKRTFERHLADAGLRLAGVVEVGLGRDRVASSRSTHHGRDTGMLARDYLFLTS